MCMIHVNSDRCRTKTLVFGIDIGIVILYQWVNPQNWVLSPRYPPTEASVRATVDLDIVPNLDWVLGRFRVVGVVV